MPAPYQDPYSLTYAYNPSLTRAPQPTQTKGATKEYAQYPQDVINRFNTQIRNGVIGPKTIDQIFQEMYPNTPLPTKAADAGVGTQASLPPPNIYGISGASDQRFVNINPAGGMATPRYSGGQPTGYPGNTGPMLPSNVNASNLYGTPPMAQPYMPASTQMYPLAYNNYLQSNYGNPSYVDMGTGFTWQPMPSQYYGGPFMPQQVSATPGGQYDMRIWAPGMPWQSATPGYGNYSPTNMPWIPPAAPAPAPAPATTGGVPTSQRASGEGTQNLQDFYSLGKGAVPTQVEGGGISYPGETYVRKPGGYLGYDPLGAPIFQSTNQSQPPAGWLPYGGAPTRDVAGWYNDLMINKPANPTKMPAQTATPAPKPAANAPTPQPAPAPTTTKPTSTSGLADLMRPRKTAAGVTPTAQVINASAENRNGPVGLASQRRLFW